MGVQVLNYWKSVGLCDSASPLMEQILYFHDYLVSTMSLIFFFVGVCMLVMHQTSFINREFYDFFELEVVWTILPMLLLLSVGFPSLVLLYMSDDVSSSELTLKIMGHQWYWSYEYSNLSELSFDSYMVLGADLQSSSFRNLEVDNSVYIPLGIPMRVLVSSTDVIHCWSVNSLGVKVDAIPGRLNQLGFEAHRLGVFYGQCSEICGANHSFMPIKVECVLVKDFF